MVKIGNKHLFIRVEYTTGTLWKLIECSIFILGICDPFESQYGYIGNQKCHYDLNIYFILFSSFIVFFSSFYLLTLYFLSDFRFQNKKLPLVNKSNSSMA